MSTPVSRSTIPLPSQALLGTRTPDPFLTIENEDGGCWGLDGGIHLHNAAILTAAHLRWLEAPRDDFWASRRGLGAR